MNQIQQTSLSLGSKRSILLILVLTFLSFISLWYFSLMYSKNLGEEHTALKIQQALIEKTDEIQSAFTEIKEAVQQDDLTIKSLMDLSKKTQCDFFVVKDDSIKYWTSNLVSVEKIMENEPGILKLNNGWYTFHVSKENSTKFLALFLIKKEFKYSNNFLSKSFNPLFEVNDYFDISLKQDGQEIWDENGNFLFSIKRNAIKKITDKQAYVLFVLFHLLLFFILLLSKISYQHFAKLISRKSLIPFLIIVDIFVLWLLINVIEAPKILFNSNLYAPVIFENQFKLSIASYFTNTALVLFAVYVLFHKRYLLNYILINSPRLKALLLIPLIFTAFIFFEKSVLELLTFYDLSFQFGQDFISNPGDSLIIFTVLSMLSYGLFIVLQSVFIDIKNLKIENRKYFSYLGIFLLLGSLIFYFVCSFSFLAILLFAVLMISMQLVNVKKLSAIQLVFYLIVFSLYMSIISSSILGEKEINKRSILSERLSGMQDPIAEFDFPTIEKNIYADTSLIQLLEYPISDSVENIIVQKIENQFAKGEWNKYTAYITICDSTKVLDIQPDNYLMNCSDYFKDFINNFSDAFPVDNLIHIKSNNLNNSYIATFNFDVDKDGFTDINIYVELISEFIPEGVGYTELFSDDSYEIQAKDIINYSFAKYENGQLVYKFGSHFYNSNLSEYTSLDKSKISLQKNGYDHLIYSKDENSALIISRPQSTLWERIAPFSYFFIQFSIFVLLIALLSNLSLNVLFVPFSFKKKIQFSMTGIILFSFFIIGFITLFYIVEINNNKNKEILNEKAHSVLVELEHKLSSEDALPVEMTEYLNTLLNKFSLVFFSDINLYDLHGRMIASSRPRIVNEGLISSLMNPNAFKVLSKNEKLIFIQDEAIGDYNYLSAYLPFRNADNQIIAYLNLPYFARQSEIQKEITTFLVALVNIYLLLFVMSIIIALIISRTMSRPLEMIRNRIGQIQLGGTNEKIDWQKTDELGSLITEYNRMIDELAESADLLAKSERESAWREMAKQVAHEIKNPLTPMKLSVQYLKKRWDDKVPDWEEELQRFTNTIIQQIDTLSEIASAFSDFAKMPRKKPEKIDIEDVVLKSIGLFKEHEHLKIQFESPSTNCYINGDTNQLLRVFNNLIKNSIQAIGKRDNGEITIQLEKHENHCLIAVKDNGIGISEDQTEKIFSPSFTTKSSGMGMGLSIVKSIVLETGGRIWFESEVNNGATFYIEFPLFQNENEN